MRSQWWPTVLLECDSNLASSGYDIEKKAIFLKKKYFTNFLFFLSTFLPVVRCCNLSNNRKIKKGNTVFERFAMVY